MSTFKDASTTAIFSDSVGSGVSIAGTGLIINDCKSGNSEIIVRNGDNGLGDEGVGEHDISSIDRGWYVVFSGSSSSLSMCANLSFNCFIFSTIESSDDAVLSV